MPDPALGAAVRKVREERGETRETLAFRAGITNGALARIELGLASPRWATVALLAQALGLQVSALARVAERDCLEALRVIAG